MAKAHMAAIAFLMATNACVAEYDESVEEEQMPFAETEGVAPAQNPMVKAADGTCGTRVTAKFDRVGTYHGRIQIRWTDACDGRTRADLRMNWEMDAQPGYGHLDGWLHTRAGVFPAFGKWERIPGNTDRAFIRITADDNASGVELLEIEGNVFFSAGAPYYPTHMAGIAAF
jgi:hypothetical protein